MGYEERWERLCAEVIHLPEKTGGRYKGKNKRATVIIQIFVRLKVKAEYARGPLAIRFLFHVGSIHPSIRPQHHFSVRHLSFWPFTSKLITSLYETCMLDISSLYTSMSSSVYPFILPAVHPPASFIFCAWLAHRAVRKYWYMSISHCYVCNIKSILKNAVLIFN